MRKPISDNEKKLIECFDNYLEQDGTLMSNAPKNVKQTYDKFMQMAKEEEAFELSLL